jgi:hypothetical protein
MRRHAGFRPETDWSAWVRLSPLISLFLFLLIAMPLDGEEHACAQHENLERKEDYGEPVPNAGRFHAIT